MEDEEDDLIDDTEEGMVGEEYDGVEIIEDEENELHYSVEGLGQFHEIEGQKLFVKTDDCVHCIHDIQVALRKEDSRKVDKYLGQWQTLEKRLVPLFLHYREDSKIWNGVLKLLVILTRPLQKGTPDIAMHIKFLQDYKEAMNTQDMFITLMSILMDAVSHNEQTDTQINEIETQILEIDTQMKKQAAPMESVADPTDPMGETQQVNLEAKQLKKEVRRLKEGKRVEIRALSEKSKVHEKNVELVLTLVRHILEIPDPKPGDASYSQSRGSMQVQLIKHLSDEGVLDLLIMFAEQIDLPKFRHLNWLFFEVFYHVCATIPPAELANYDQFLKVDLSRLLDIEKKLVYAQVPQYSRHSRFANASVLKHVVPASAGGSSEHAKAARGRFYREKKTQGDQQPNLFQDPAFIDIINESAAGLPSSILGKDYRDFFADIKAFVDQFLETVFPQLMKSVYSEVESEKNLHDYDTVRVLNMIAWILDYQGKLVRRSRKVSIPAPPMAAWAVSQDALNLVTRQVKQHSKEAKTIRGGGANLVVALRALVEQLRIARILGKDNAVSFTILDSISYDELYRHLTWTVRNYKPTAHRPELLGFAVQSLEEYLKLADLYAKEGVARIIDEKKKKQTASKAKRLELEGSEFYDPGHSDSDDVSIASSASDEEDLNFADSVMRGKEVVLAEVAHGEAIRNFFHLLTMFKENAPGVNDAVCALILRIVKENDSFVAFFFQLSYLVILFNIINDPSLRAVQEERRKFDSVILIAKLIIRRFVSVAKVNKLIFVEILFPRLKSGRSGHLLSLESDLRSICCNYTDEETRIVLERIHQGDSYDNLKAERREQAAYTQPWTQDEDQQLIGLWEHVKEMDGKSNRDKISTVIANIVPLEGKHKRRFKDVKLRLLALGLLKASEESDDYTDGYSSDGDHRSNQYRSESGASASNTESEDDTNPLNFQEYVKRVNAVKISDKMTRIFDQIIDLDLGITENEKQKLGKDCLLKFFGA